MDFAYAIGSRVVLLQGRSSAHTIHWGNSMNNYVGQVGEVFEALDYFNRPIYAVRFEDDWWHCEEQWLKPYDINDSVSDDDKATIESFIDEW